MAEIYLARVNGQAGFEKLCVLKRILPNVAEDPAFVQMFLEEARLAATLRHGNIADTYDVGEANGTYFFTMEYVYGQDARVIRHETNKRAEQIPLAIALAIVHGAASALEHAHEKRGSDGKLLGLVHRDVSASNVMVSYDGAVKLLDFGIARASTSASKTQTGTLKGKIPYMSPEQCKGHALDRRSDLFSLGVVLYEVTVGRRPFRGDSDFQIMDQIVYKGAVPPSQMVRGYPAELEAIVMKLLDRDANKRYATASELLQELDEFVAKHGLWLSPRAIGKYMRTLFADRIQAWEQAEQEGRTFTQHVVESVTSKSQRSELVTPPSEFPGLEPATPSQELRAQRPPEPPPEPIATMAPLPVMRAQLPTPPVFQAQPDPAPLPVRPTRVPAPAEPFEQVYPSLKPKSSRTVMFALIGMLVLGAGGVLGYVVSQSAKATAPKPAPVEDKHEMPAVEATPEAETKPAEVVKPSSFDSKRTEPTVQPTTKTETKRVETKPAETKPAEPVKPVEIKKPADTKPAETKPATNPPKPPPRPVVPKKPKEKTWDPNSPFLPG